MICPSCKTANRDTNRFCTQCGGRLDVNCIQKGRLIVISEPGHVPNQRRRKPENQIKTERRAGVEIVQKAFSIGRQMDNSFILDDDQASGRHARILSDGQHFHIEDLGSTNGTFVDGVRIQGPTMLKPECLIKIGATIVKFEFFPDDNPR